MPSWYVIIRLLALAILGATGIIGNALVIIAFLRNRRLRTTAHIFLLNLATCDILVCMINIPMTAITLVTEKWIFSRPSCIILGYISVVLFIASVAAMVLLTYHRFVSVVKWSTEYLIFSQKRVRIAIFMTWAISFCLAAPPLLGWGRYSYIPEAYHCFVDWKHSMSYTVFMTLTCFIVPLVIVTKSYRGIYLASQKSKRQVCSSVNDVTRPVAKSETKMTCMIIAILLAFVICWLPYVTSAYIDILSGKIQPEAKATGLLFGQANPAVDFIIYVILNKKVRCDIRKLLRPGD